ncbi:MAG: hypothetical protein II820_06945 [Ruminiclostridium sp.]|nr:hypothetical protein [Ruminiclostridium sp.]
MKACRIIHVAANIIAFGSLTVSLVFFLLSYSGLPERIGVHFSAVDGQLDVFSYKVFGFYPFVMGFALLLIFSLLSLAVRKIKKLGLRITENGEQKFRCAAVLMLDLMKLIWAAFFSYWAYCVVRQTSMGDGTLLDAFRIFFLLVLLSIPIMLSEIKERNKPEMQETAESEMPEDDAEAAKAPLAFTITHIAAHALSFGMLGGFLIYFLLSYDGLPERIGVHFGSDGSFDVFSYKEFGYYPFVAGFGLLILFSLLTLAAKKIKRVGMNVSKKGDMAIRRIIMEVLDSLKLIWSLFFSMWAYCVINQVGMNTTFTAILTTAFLALLPITAVIIIITARKYRKK